MSPPSPASLIIDEYNDEYILMNIYDHIPTVSHSESFVLIKVAEFGAKRQKGFGENIPRAPRGCHEVTGGGVRETAGFEY